MFTGIIEEIGTVKQLVPGKVSYRLSEERIFLHCMQEAGSILNVH